ncbi:MAG: GAF domain-containing protein [Cyclobacteriaceae bacterium]|nr:MAG: GAF domain-containing protein [Cyclobacteriaceae bacterium]
MENKKRRFRIRFTIGNKILLVFGILIVLFVGLSTAIFITGSSINTVVNKSAEVVRPSKDAINEFVLAVERYQKLITSWVYLQTNEENKNALLLLVSTEYPKIKEDIDKLKVTWEVDSQKVLVDSVFIRFDEVQGYAKSQIMDQLNSFESYEDGITKLLAEDVLANTINPQLEDILEDLKALAQAQTNTNELADQELISTSKFLRNITLILAAAFLVIALVSAYLLMRSITRPVNFLKDVVTKLGRGELVEDKQTKFSNDEIGEMAVAMDNLVTGLKGTTLFAENIGKGNYASEFKPLSEHDVLGNALLNMRDNLAAVAEDDKKRNWATEGLAKFGEILRSNTNDLEKLSDEIIANLVKYLKANQGALYIMDDEEGEEQAMSMRACYAWDKKKYLNHKIHKGEGLSGQAWQEGDTIYLTEVPQNYIKISSGLGDANPTSVLIVPLKVNDQIFGVVEIASFNTFADFEMEFVQKIAESIASTISSVKINARTQRLLEESQEMTEQMRAQEEEMRQNMEELQATQEEMQRNQSETEGTMQALNSALAMADYDVEGKLTKINTNYLSMLGYSQTEVMGEHHRIFATKEDKSSEEYRQFWRDLEAGKSRKGIYKRLTRKGEVINVRSYFSPVKNHNGEIVRIMEISVEA